MGKDFVISFRPESERGKEFEQLFGRTEFNVESFIPMMVELPGFDEPQKVFLLDLKFLTTKERIKLCLHLAQKFNLPVEEVESSIDQEGVPILDQDVYLAIHNPLRWL